MRVAAAFVVLLFSALVFGHAEKWQIQSDPQPRFRVRNVFKTHDGTVLLEMQPMSPVELITIVKKGRPAPQQNAVVICQTEIVKEWNAAYTELHCGATDAELNAVVFPPR